MDIRAQLRKIFMHIGLQGYIRPINFAHNKLSKILRMTIRKAKMPQTLIFYLDPSIGHPGLADRLKAIIGCYHIAQNNHMGFRIVFDFPFSLSDYLSPNEVDWRCRKEDVRFSIVNSRFFDYEGEMVTLQSNMQYVCINYVGILPTPTSKLGNKLLNNDIPTLWNQLFKQNEYLRQAIESQGYEAKSYVAVHLRFINAFEHFEKSTRAALSPQQQHDLLQRCREGLIRIHAAHQREKILVFSDSAYFLSKIKDLPVESLESTHISHIRYTNSSDSTLKTFIDFFMISRAKAVYRVLAPEMYKTGYSELAAIIGEVPLYDLNV